MASPGIIGTEYGPDDVNPPGDVVMFQVEGSPILALYPPAALAKDAGMEPTPPASGAFSLGHFVDDRREVDAVLERASRAGARVSRGPRDRPWGI